MRTRAPRGSLLRAVALCLAALYAVSTLAAGADDYVRKAREHLAGGEGRAAIIELKNALQSDPSHVQARAMLGTLYLAQNDGPAAAKEFSRARDLGAEPAQWTEGYARALMMQGQFQALLDEVRDDPALAPALRAEILALRGNANLGLRQTEAATTEYDAALAIDAGHPMARLGKAQILASQGRADDALVELDAVLAANPKHVESLLARADLLRLRQRLDDAAADYARAAAEAPANPRAHIGLALVHIAQRDTAAARQDLAVLDRLAPDLPVVRYLRALTAFQDKNYDQASDELQNLLRIAPANLQAQLLYGLVSYARNEFTIADDYLTRVFASAPGNPQVAKLLGAARLKLRQPDRAVQALAGVVNDATSDAQLLALLGTAYLQTGDNSKGAEYIQRAVELDPEQALLRTQLAVGKIATGDTAGAIAQLESAVALGQDVVQADVLLVLSYLNRQEYDRAVSAAEALQERMADSPIPYNLTGLAYLAQRRFDEAGAHFERALEKDPTFLVARMNLARLALVAQRPADAAAAYTQVLEQDPRHLGAMLGMAALARAEKDEAALEDWLMRAHDANPAAPQPVIALAEVYLRRNDGLKANNLLAALSPEQAELPAALRLKGIAQLQSGDYASAVFTLKKLTELQPEQIEGWFQLGRAQAAAGDAASARTSFQRAIGLDAAHKVPVVWVGLAELELRERNHDAALDLAKQIQAHFPGAVFGHDIEASAYRGKGQPAQALAAAETALRIDPGSRRVNEFASQLNAAGQQQRAVTVLGDWLEAHPDDGAAWANLGMLQQLLGDIPAALAAYEKSVAHADANAVILNNMAWLYLDRDAKRAVELATRAYELAPGRAEIVDTYGWVLFRSGRKRDGLAALQQALVIAPRNAEIALHVAEALIDANRDGEARPLLERVLREQPTGQFGDTARALMGRLRG